MPEKQPQPSSAEVIAVTSSSPKSTSKDKLHVKWTEFRKRYLTPRRLIFSTIWILVHTGLFVYAWSFPYSNGIRNRLINRIRQGTDQRLAQTNTVGYSVSLSRGAGLCIVFDTALILLPMLRTIITTIYPKFTLLPLDENIWFHRQVPPLSSLYFLPILFSHY